MDVSEIVNRGSFELWLIETNQSVENRVALAHRDAMRLLPGAWKTISAQSKYELAALSILRCYLVSWAVAFVADNRDSIRIAQLAYSAAYHAEPNGLGDPEAVAYRSAYKATIVTSGAEAYPYPVRDPDYYVRIRADCRLIAASKGLETVKLWWTDNGYFSTEWAELKKSLIIQAARSNEATARGGDELDWTFFVDFYERSLNGEPQDQALIEEIVHSDEINWDSPSQALGVINRMWREAKGTRSPVASAALTDFTFAANYNQMVAIGFDLDRDHWRDPSVVAGFLEDIEDLKDLIQNFSDFARDHLAGGNAEVDVVMQNDALLKELDFCDERQRIRPGNILSLAMVLEDASNDVETNSVLGEGLANMLDRNLEQMRKISATHFTKDMQRLEPLDAMSLDSLSAEQVVNRLDDAFTALVKAGQDDLIPLRDEDANALRQMIESLKDVEASIDATSDEKFKERQKRKIARRAGALGNTIGYLYERTIMATKKTGAVSDKVIALFKRVKSLNEIYRALEDLIKSFGGG